MTDPTHPPTEAVGEVRRLPEALDPPTPTLAERAQERRREEIISGLKRLHERILAERNAAT